MKGMASPIDFVRNLGGRLGIHRPSSRKAATAVVWYVESRAVNEIGPAPEEAVRGSSVVVCLERLQRTDRPEGAQWMPKDPPDLKKYLLTCAHVVRGFRPGAAGWNPLLGEILCWAPGSPFLHWQFTDRARKSGESKPIGAHRVRLAIAPRPEPGSVSAEQATASNDWVLLEFEDDTLDGAPSVGLWRDLDRDDEGGIALVGYPGGAATWTHNARVTPHISDGFSFKREDEGGGVLRGPDEARPGMSGGGVFDRDCALVGIHRASTDIAMERQLVGADEIRQWLDARGLRPAPVTAKSSGGWVVKAALVGVMVSLIAGWQFGLVAWLRNHFPPRTVESVCVNVQGGEDPALLQPIRGLRLSVVADGWVLPVQPIAETGADGKACFTFNIPDALRDRGTFPVHIRSENAPTPLQDRAPLMVDPYGITTVGMRKSPVDVAPFLAAASPTPLTLTVYSEEKWLAAQLSRQMQASVNVTVDQVSKATRELGYTRSQAQSSVQAWANVLQTERPMVPMDALKDPGRESIRRVAASVGAVYENGNMVATGFVVSPRVVLVPNFALMNASAERAIVFDDHVKGPANRIKLGRVLWRDTSQEISVALLEATAPLPLPLQLSNTPAATIGADHDIYVVAYPMDDPRTPTEFRNLIPVGRRSAMFGVTIRPFEQGGVPMDRSWRLLYHDATTIGGTAGGPVVDGETHVVIGVHLAGNFTGSLEKFNFGTSMAALLADPEFRHAAFGATASPTLTTISADVDLDPLRLAGQEKRTAGYDPMFLGVPIPMPAAGGASPRALDYLHYSVVMSNDRPMARLAAGNVDRTTRERVPRGAGDRWFVDPRLPLDRQPTDELFANNPLDRGHLISRTALAWGSPAVAKLAAVGAFYWTNATPQHARLNQGAWARLERRVYEELEPNSQRLSVFAGPVEEPGDIIYRGQRLPRRFWLVAAFQNRANLSAPIVHAFIATQYQPGSSGDPDQWSVFPDVMEVPLADVERATGLSFRLSRSPATISLNDMLNRLGTMAKDRHSRQIGADVDLLGRQVLAATR